MKKFPVHTFCFSLYPIVYLYSVSVTEVRLSDIIVPLIISFFALVILYLFFFLITRNSLVSAIQTSLIHFVFFNLGRIIIIFKNYGLFTYDLRPLIIFQLIFVILVSWVNLRLIKNHEALTEFLNVVSAVLFIMPFITIINTVRQPDIFTPSSTIEKGITQTYLPDIYYIVVDSYAGNDLLAEVYGYENSSFLNSLEQKGFHIIKDSHSNYIHTWQSLGSTLNLNYFHLQERGIFSSAIQGQGNLHKSNAMVSNNYVKSQLIDLGYQIYVIPNNFLVTSWEDANLVGRIPIASPFLFEYLHSSAFLFFSYSLPYEIYQDQILRSFNLMEEAIEYEGPKFVFFHVSIPHPPFVFDEDGNSNYTNVPFSFTPSVYYSMSTETFHKKYIQQLQFTNSNLDPILDKIISSQPKNAIIIIQGDHGPASYTDFRVLDNNRCLFERYSIINAVYYPDGDYRALEQTHTPVNTFRIIFEQYFNFPFDVLNDQAFYSSDDDIMDFIDVTKLVESRYCEP